MTNGKPRKAALLCYREWEADVRAGKHIGQISTEHRGFELRIS